ncbi:hypothetical protein [Halomonas sp. I5-271120]|uniref:Nmad2 family putative nucleotide modification protein n=1 Tax=Halomonas sp. I5-271120 TaxID=3061632 RepID=UPI002714BA2A|nr:hypothetical protein [Halomonas sp. I5-271120]
MSRLYTYIVKVDSGLAPNPFSGWCSLAVCTPNHQGSAVRQGDWIAGFSPKGDGYQFIYAMKVDERIHMNDYFHDPRFQSKKPIMNGGWKERCGDNFYWQNCKGAWLQLANPFHEWMLDKDTHVPYVFVGKEFWYLGRARSDVPMEFLAMIGGRGARVNHPAGLPESFMRWVRHNFKPGITAAPLDAEAESCTQSGAMLSATCKLSSCNNA